MPVYDAQGPVVSVVAVFGANASGKSNLLDAIAWMRTAVLDSFRVWEAGSGIPRTRYRLDADETKPSEFVADLILDGVQWVYGFSATSEAVQEEWLHSYPQGRKRVIFERESQKIELGSTIPERRSRGEILRSLLRENALLLSTAVQLNLKEAEPVYHWFRRQLLLPNVLEPLMHRRIRLPFLIASALAHHPELVDLIKAADMGISGLTVDEPTPGSGRTAPEVKFLHGPDSVPLDLSDESEGTLAWTELLTVALDALGGGAVLVVDEIDASLHPQLTARLVELFRSPETNSSGAQLLFTTHDATLLGTNLNADVLRRDEIWFVEKKPDGASTLFPLSDFRPRKGENWERRYLVGSYGAVPEVYESTLVNRVRNFREEGHHDAV
ncbi:ATP-binding protein [Actinoplanes sp. NPDC026619]|uniref:AAA family ATPase n=1 Tax=Actinoplanes sp. NPDC026619 TaxID=3155798 RepID=UPI0033EC7568